MKKLIATVMLLASTSLANATGSNLDVLFSFESNPEAWCLAQNIYYEARGSNKADRIAVADVVLNRVDDSRYPNTVCEVVKQGKYKPSWKDPNVLVPVQNQCQFSWWCDGKSDNPTDIDAWVDAQQIAYHMLYLNSYRGITDGSTHYHADWITDPRWAKGMDPKGTIGNHKFYRWSQ